ncbi:hypothetical protein [Polycladidibacter hongkongensis]|uniref:hypothetical protein n=1 Tax=Polycladidibacter hongkongensis TaxID=1647556 RepID=UPI00082D6CAB|nr:hypothetical protein [Pseudovibrio hongkongensis]
MRTPIFTIAFLSATIVVPLAGHELHAADMPANTPQLSKEYSNLPACADESVARAVARQISRADTFYYNGRTLQQVYHPADQGLERYPESSITRRNCSATALLSDGSTYPLFYRIVEDQGIFGISWGVEACLSGLDKFHVYNAACRSIRRNM